MKLCPIDAIIEGTSRGFDISGKELLAVKKDGQVHVYVNNCPHLDTRLEYDDDEFLDMDGALIHCSNHGALFTIETGECVSGPCLGDRLEKLNVTIQEGIILVD